MSSAEVCEEEEIVYVVPSCVENAEFLRKIEEGPNVKGVMKWVSKEWPPTKELGDLIPFYLVQTELSVSGSLLFRGERLVPTSLAVFLIEAAHESHLGINRTKQRLRDGYWWPVMDR